MQDFVLECESGGKRERCEAFFLDGSGSVVEILPQNWAPLDREVRLATARQTSRGAMVQYAESMHGEMRCRTSLGWPLQDKLLGHSAPQSS